MKKIFLTFLLLIITCHAQGESCSEEGAPIPVNQPIVIQAPPTIQAPPCAAPPVINIPTINPPNYIPPKVNPIIVAPPLRVAPNVIAPPTVTPPAVNPPTINPPNIPIPQLPSIVPPPSYIPPPPQPPSIPTPTIPTIPTSYNTLSKIFVLQFQYACRRYISFNSCEGEVIWNNQIIYSVVPTNYNIVNITLQVTIQAGRNTLQFEGAGVSDSYGLGIDNVILIRQGDPTNTNIVINGDFSSPQEYGSWGLYNDISGWSGVGIEVGYGQIYNNWPGQICELDGNVNYEITQTFWFDSTFHQISGQPLEACPNPAPGVNLIYTLEFNYAARQNYVNSSNADVLWNNVVIASLVPNDTLIYHVDIQVTLNVGDNILQFDGAALSDSYGITINNVTLSSQYDPTNLIVNGLFTDPAVPAHQFQYVNGGIHGWAAYKAEVGDCSLYTPNWPSSGAQCIELDSDSNQRYTQVITINQQTYSNLVLQVQSVNGNQAIHQTTNLAVGQAELNSATAVANLVGAVQASIAFTAADFYTYLQQLYGYSSAAVQALQNNLIIEVNEYAVQSTTWINQYGNGNEVDFSCDGYDDSQLQEYTGVIVGINGKTLQSSDHQGNNYHLQVSPCSHFEGTYPLPRVGDTISWKGPQSSSGIIYVLVGTTCSC